MLLCSAFPSRGTLPQSAQRRSHQRRPLPQIRPPQLREACALLGDESRAEIIAETNPAGCAVWHVLNLNGVIPTAEFVSVRSLSPAYPRLWRLTLAVAVVGQWWMVQDLSEALSEWMDDEFPGSVPIEQHDRNFRCDSPPFRAC